MAKKSGEYRVGDWTPNSTIETRGITYVSGEVIPVDHLPAKEVERLVADVLQLNRRDRSAPERIQVGLLNVLDAAVRHGARGFGVDINPERVAEAEASALKHKVTDKVAFYQRDLFATDFSQATVISMYLLPRVNMELRPRLLNLQAGTRIVSHDFDMDDWKPEETVHLEVKEKYGSAGGTSSVYFWVVPAKVAGNWNWEQREQNVGGKPQNLELALEQKFQVISGTLRVNGNAVKIVDADDPTRELPAGEVGEILLTGPQIMRGYFNSDNLLEKQ